MIKGPGFEGDLPSHCLGRDGSRNGRVDPGMDADVRARLRVWPPSVVFAQEVEAGTDRPLSRLIQPDGRRCGGRCLTRS
jgi:hypothetical protein